MSAPAVPLTLDASAVQYAAARIQTAAELLEKILAEAFTDHKVANLIFRDALVLFLKQESSELEEGASGALKGKACWPATDPPATPGVRPLFEGLGKEGAS
ncbi:MAG: hypothetical protein Q7W02_00125 [Candidatus Rokubacteria bacterium]|nr:hypothetical protein [Candidatus Rokubacteria bacterium]